MANILWYHRDPQSKRSSEILASCQCSQGYGRYECKSTSHWMSSFSYFHLRPGCMKPAMDPPVHGESDGVSQVSSQ